MTREKAEVNRNLIKDVTGVQVMGGHLVVENDQKKGNTLHNIP